MVCIYSVFDCCPYSGHYWRTSWLQALKGSKDVIKGNSHWTVVPCYCDRSGPQCLVITPAIFFFFFCWKSFIKKTLVDQLVHLIADFLYLMVQQIKMVIKKKWWTIHILWDWHTSNNTCSRVCCAFKENTINIICLPEWLLMVRKQF